MIHDIEKLENLYSGITNNINDADNSCKVLELLHNSIDIYKTTANSFFVGKEANIKRIFEAIRKKEFPYNKVNLYDVNYAMFTYDDFVSGMMSYVSRIFALNNEDEVEGATVASSIEEVTTRNLAFLDSIHGGENNETTSMDIDTAMKNVESMIKLVEEFDNLDNMVKSLVNVCDSDKYSNEVLMASKLLANSICTHLYKSLLEIFKSYDAIEESMKNRTPVSGEKVVPQYQLF